MTTPAAGWHDGERALQQRAGVGARMAELGGRVLRDYMPDQHRTFFAELPFLVAGTLDAAGQPWASILAGPPGFVQSPAPRLLRIDVRPPADHLAASHLRVGAPLALLGIQAHTGRRNRMNGWIAAADAEGFEVRVGQSFGNCPKYIHPREAIHVPATAPGEPRTMPALDADSLRIVREADTFFIATTHPQARDTRDPVAGIDVSHRGGPPGFVQVRPDGTLLVPDYVGNSFFNTLGNLQLEPRCGLLFIDHASGEQLHLSARAQVVWEVPETAALPKPLRLLHLEVHQAVHVRGGLPLRWRVGA